MMFLLTFTFPSLIQTFKCENEDECVKYIFGYLKKQKTVITTKKIKSNLLCSSFNSYARVFFKIFTRTKEGPFIRMDKKDDIHIE